MIGRKMKNIILIIITAAVVGVAAFWGGTYYQQQQFQNRAARFAGISPEQFKNRGGLFAGRQGNSGPGRQRGYRNLSGRLDKINNDTIIITTRFGSQEIKLDDKTKVNIAAPADKTKLKTGSDLAIKIKRLDDGTLKADSITQTN